MKTYDFPYSVYVSSPFHNRMICVLDRTSNLANALHLYAMMIENEVDTVILYDLNAITNENPTGLRFKHKAEH